MAQTCMVNSGILVLSFHVAFLVSMAAITPSRKWVKTTDWRLGATQLQR